MHAYFSIIAFLSPNGDFGFRIPFENNFRLMKFSRKILKWVNVPKNDKNWPKSFKIAKNYSRMSSRWTMSKCFEPSWTDFKLVSETSRGVVTRKFNRSAFVCNLFQSGHCDVNILIHLWVNVVKKLIHFRSFWNWIKLTFCKYLHTPIHRSDPTMIHFPKKVF